METMLIVHLVGLLLLAACVTCLDNGLALTPPMGWLTWQRYRCNTDCVGDPDNCISEKLIKRMADCYVSEGYVDAGYQYITIDDCWPTKERDAQGRLQADPKRFPSGIKALADYVHGKKLKMGIYEDFGTKTCAGYPGSEFYMQTDAQTFADWGIDLVKFDGCNSDYKDDPYGYTAFGFQLNKTGKPIVYSCEWPLYDRQSNWTAIRETCNMWRLYNDINDSWESVSNILDYYTKNNKKFQQYAGPGGWSDPDMLVIGNFGLSDDQERTQMAMWSIFAAPLVMSNDLCHVRASSKKILQNKRVIAVNQDKLGVQGSLKTTKSGVEIWTRPILPTGSWAVVFLNKPPGGEPAHVTVTFKEIGLTNERGYNVTELFDGKPLGPWKGTEELKVWVNPTGVFMMTAVALQ